MSEPTVPKMPPEAHEALWALIQATREFARRRAMEAMPSEQSSAETIAAEGDACQAQAEKLAEK